MAQEQLETKEETKEVLTCKGLVAGTRLGEKSVNNKNMLSVQVETKNSVEKHMRKLRASGFRNQIAPEPELTKTQNVLAMVCQVKIVIWISH